MKRILVTIGWLMWASASFGSDGQHTGVGGNPLTPPANPHATGPQTAQFQMVIYPGLIMMQPEFSLQDASQPEEASRTEDRNQDSKAGETSAQ